MEQSKGKKYNHKKNSLSLNKFHQLSRNKRSDEVTSKKLKKQVRDIQRLIDSGKIGEDVKEIKQKQMEEISKQLATKKQMHRQKIKKIDYFQQKYKKIKVVDLKKLNRKLAQLQRKLETEDQELREQLKQEESKILESINYIKYYPKDKKYISLFGKSLNEHANQQQAELITKTQEKTRLREARKFTMTEQKREIIDDDFFVEEAEPMVKKMVDKKGKTSQKYEDYLKDFKIPIVANLNSATPLNSDGFYKLYPGLIPPHSIEPIQFLVNNPEKNKLLMESLQKENEIIKEELKQQAQDIVYLTQVINSLIDENSSVAILLSNKDMEIHQIIETVTIKESEEVCDIKHQLRLIEDENSILQKHIQQQKEQYQQLSNQFKQSDNQVQRSKELIQRLEQQIQSFRTAEETSAREISLLKQNYSETLDLKNEFQQQCLSQESTINSLNQQYQQISKQYQEQQNDYDQYLEDKNQKISLQNNKIYDLSAQIDEKQNELEKQIILQTQISEEMNNYYTQCVDLQNLCDHLAEQNDSFANKLLMEAQKQQRSSDLIKEMESIIDDLENTKNQQGLILKEQQKEIQKLIEQNSTDLKQQKFKYDQHIEKLKQQYDESLQEKNDQLYEIQNNKEKEDNLLDEVQNENTKLQLELSHLHQELHDYEQQKKIIEQLQLQLRQAKVQIKEDKSLLQELSTYRQGVNVDLDERDQKIMKIVEEKNSRIDDLQRELDFSNEKCIFLEDHKRNTEELEKQNYTYKQQKDILEYEIKNAKQEIENLKQQITNVQKGAKSSKQKQDQQLIEENKQLRQENNELNQQLMRMRDINQQTIKAPSETSNSRITPGSRQHIQRGNSPPQNDFQQTKPKDVYQKPPSQQQLNYSPHNSRSASINQLPQQYQQNLNDSIDDVQNLLDSSGSSIGGTQDKKLHFSFAQQPQQQQQKQQQQQQQQYQYPPPQPYQQRRPERLSSQGSLMSNAPYVKRK